MIIHFRWGLLATPRGLLIRGNWETKKLLIDQLKKNITILPNVKFEKVWIQRQSVYCRAPVAIFGRYRSPNIIFSYPWHIRRQIRCSWPGSGLASCLVVLWLWLWRPLEAARHSLTCLLHRHCCSRPGPLHWQPCWSSNRYQNYLQYFVTATLWYF